MQRTLHWLLGALVVLQLASAVNIVYDETRWTKEDWHKYRIEFDPLETFNPSEEAALPAALKKALAGSSFNSLDGPLQRRAVSKAPGWVAVRMPQHAMLLAPCAIRSVRQCCLPPTHPFRAPYPQAVAGQGRWIADR